MSSPPHGSERRTRFPGLPVAVRRRFILGAEVHDVFLLGVFTGQLTMVPVIIYIALKSRR